jgi:hypothetical protein
MGKTQVLQEAESYRLISDGQRFAVIEARAGRVYSLDPTGRNKAPDTPTGMRSVVGPGGWSDEEQARRRFREMVRGEERYAERMW